MKPRRKGTIATKSKSSDKSGAEKNLTINGDIRIITNEMSAPLRIEIVQAVLTYSSNFFFS